MSAVTVKPRLVVYQAFDDQGIEMIFDNLNMEEMSA
jgi:hypothetical protein